MIDKFEFSYQGTRDRCDICNGIIDKFQVAAKGEVDESTVLTICERCLAEPDKINEKLERNAVSSEEWGRSQARWLRGLIGQLRNLPSHAQWKAESDFADARYGTDLTREQWDSWTPKQQQAWKHHGHQAWWNNEPGARSLVPEIKRPPLTDEEREKMMTIPF